MKVVPVMRELMAEELAYKRKARLRGKNRKVTIEQAYDMDNLIRADKEARRGKRFHKGVMQFDADREGNFRKIQDSLRDLTYKTSEGHICKRLCPCGKVRLLHKLPYKPDHIIHHAVMQILLPIMMRYFYFDSSASIKGKGMHFAAKRVRKFINMNKDAEKLYYVKLDFVKFYHKIVQRFIEEHLFKTFGDKGLRYVIHEIVTTCEEGLGIGLFPIQSMANFYTSKLCRVVKKGKGRKTMKAERIFLTIYCDDIVIIGRSKKAVWDAVKEVKEYAENVMCQPLHDNIGMQIIDDTHFLDFVGYRFYKRHTLLRKRMKEKFKRSMRRRKSPMTRYRCAVSYKGWLMHCNGFNLWCRVMNMKSFKDLQIPKFDKTDGNGKRMLEGSKVSAAMLSEREVTFTDFEDNVKSKYSKPTAVVQVRDNGQYFKFFTCNEQLRQTLSYCKEKEMFPFTGTLHRKNSSGLPDYEII